MFHCQESARGSALVVALLFAFTEKAPNVREVEGNSNRDAFFNAVQACDDGNLVPGTSSDRQSISCHQPHS